MTKRHIVSYIFFLFIFFIIPGVTFAGGSCGCTLRSSINDDGNMENNRTEKTCSGPEDPQYPIEAEDCEKLLDFVGAIAGHPNMDYLSCQYFDADELCRRIWLGAEPRALPEDEKPVVSGQIPIESRNVGTSAILPNCALEGTCRNANDLLQLAINIGQYIFGIIGSVAFVVFIYGGFTVVTSFGNSEKVKKGYGILSAGIIGLAIAFGAYVLVEFVLDALQVQEGFRVIQ
ncbi:MAG: pilin [Candidatus Magasanikbacteria bacterium]